MLNEVLKIFLGFVLLVIGADLIVRGSKNIAKRFHIPEILIGLTIVAIGTSMPELIITITSAKKGLGDLIIGNAIGSNLCNILFILGLTAIIQPIKMEKEVKIIHIPFAIFTTICILAISLGWFGISRTIISKIWGIIFILLFSIYFIYPIILEIGNIIKAYKENKGKRIKNTQNILISLIQIFIGIVLLKFGGDFVVENARYIAECFNISQRIIGLTIVAIGTAFPELITSIIAAIKDSTDLAVGNLLGSCILNLLLILGIGAIIMPLEIKTEFIGNLILFLISLILILLFNFIGKKNTITRFKGSILFLMFVYYVANLFI